MQPNYKVYSESMKKISGEKIKKEVGIVRMKNESGVFEKLEGSDLRDEIVELVRGGKSRQQIIDELTRRGVSMDQYEKRKKIIALIDGLYSNEK